MAFESVISSSQLEIGRAERTNHYKRCVEPEPFCLVGSNFNVALIDFIPTTGRYIRAGYLTYSHQMRLVRKTGVLDSPKGQLSSLVPIRFEVQVEHVTKQPHRILFSMISTRHDPSKLADGRGTRYAKDECKQTIGGKATAVGHHITRRRALEGRKALSVSQACPEITE